MKGRMRLIRFIALLAFLSVFVEPLYSTISLQVRNAANTYNTTTTDSTNNCVPGFTRVTGRGRRDYLFLLYYDAFLTNSSWSGGVNITNTNWATPFMLPRRDQGNTNFAIMRNPIPNLNYVLTIISVTNPATNNPASAGKFGIFWTAAATRRITASSNNITNHAYANSNVTVFIRLNNTLNAQEFVAVRYTTNNWTNSMLSIGVAAGAPSYTATIPAMPSGTYVQYYPVTSGGTASNYLTGPDHDYVTITCLSNESSPFFYYTSGSYHQIGMDGTNDFNTNAVERFMTTTSGYTNWITWDSNFLYMGFYGADIGSASSSKVLYVYFSTNTNTNNTTGWAYANPENTQQPVLPFRANYFFRKAMSGEWSCGVWSNAQWSTNNSPLTTGASNVINGNFLELRIHRTNFQNTTTVNLTNLFLISFLMDTASGTEKIYAAAPSNTLSDGYRSNPSNYFAFRQVMWVSNNIPATNRNVTNDIDIPWTNRILGPLNNQTNITGDIITNSNFAIDMVGIYKVEFYTNNGLLTNVFVSNTNATYTVAFDTSYFKSGTYYFSSIAYDTKNIRRSYTTNTNVFIAAGSVFMPGTWDLGQFNTPFTNLYMPPGFVKRTVTASLNNYFLIHNSGWNSNHAWSFGYQINMTNIVTNITRNDQGSWPTETNWARLTVWPAVAQQLTVVATENPTNTSETFGFMTTAAAPIYITVSSNNITNDYASANSNVTVFMTISGAKSAAERIVVRYTTNDFTNSMIATATVIAGNNYSATIPAMGSGLLVKYYIINTTMADLYLTNGNDGYATLACLSNESSPFFYYTAGSYHTVAIDGVNDFNTNYAEQYLTSTDGYTNWITWDSNFLYIGYYGADIGANDANKMLYVYFSTNTNTVTNLNRITGSAYGEPQGTQLPVLPFNANYFFRYNTAGTWGTAVWTNNAWNSNVSPLDSGISVNQTGNYFEMRIHKTNFANATSIGFTNLNLLTFMLDMTPGAEQIYGASPSNALVDGYRANPSNFFRYDKVLWVSNVLPASNGNISLSNDNIAPYTNWLLGPVNNQTNHPGDIISISNFTRDETGIFRIDLYTNVSAFFTNIFVSNTNAVVLYDLDTSVLNTGTNRFYTIAYDTKNSRSSQTNIVLIRPVGKVYVPESRQDTSQFGNEATNINTAPGFVSFVTQMQRSDDFIIHKDGWQSNTSWSFGTLITAVNQPWTISRNDQGTWPSETNWAQLSGSGIPNQLRFTVFISPTNIANTTEKFGIMQTRNYPVYITDATNDDVAYANSNMTVYITLSGATSTEERIVVRYTTNAWASSMAVQAVDTGTGVDYTATIPPMKSGSTVEYYVINTTAADTYVTNGNHDYITIACFSNQQAPLSYYVSGTFHTPVVDGVNDFNTNDAEIYVTSTSGYTNWLTWDSNYLYIGYFGADISANDANKMLYIYLSTNTNRVTNLNLITGSAYGQLEGTQVPVLPFQANYFIRYVSTGTWSTGFWSNTAAAWYTNGSPLTAGVSNVRTGNYLEMRVARTNFMNSTTASFTNLNYVAFMVDKTSGGEQIYGAVPQNSLSDGYRQAPATFLFFETNMWISNLMPSDPGYESQDTVPPYTNWLLTPTNNQPVFIGDTIVLSNYARDNTGIYKVEVYTNDSALFDTIWVTNTNAYYYYNLITTNFVSGIYNFYTLAYDTANSVSSQTNTNMNFSFNTRMSIYKSISTIALPPMADLLKPGALITYQILYTNAGPNMASNVVIYEKIPDHTAYYTNYLGTATGWTPQYAHIANPDQSYASTDFDSSPVNVTWFRWKKVQVMTNESGSTLFFGITVD